MEADQAGAAKGRIQGAGRQHGARFQRFDSGPVLAANFGEVGRATRRMTRQMTGLPWHGDRVVAEK